MYSPFQKIVRICQKLFVSSKLAQILEYFSGFLLIVLRLLLPFISKYCYVHSGADPHKVMGGQLYTQKIWPQNFIYWCILVICVNCGAV